MDCVSSRGIMGGVYRAGISKIENLDYLFERCTLNGVKMEKY